VSSQETVRERRFPRRPTSVARARDFVTELLTQWHRTDRLDDARYCTSELATNAVQHGAPAGRDFLVRVAVHDELLRIEVHDSGDGAPQLRQARSTDVSGRGLLLVAALADEWGVAPRSGPRKVVWATFKLDAASPHPPHRTTGHPSRLPKEYTR
jgi:anti-sigma regulatory factor (Ser/Thr protein kinase)